ncbi:TetR family transcriptional regulator [Paenibacillus sp. LMG 31456]|uniref:TetR family transcriptional regulator n=1 Tax=Paenibacillus foliorum TaxID=2654974 RepID=A0A972JXU2_9BACL|nr:TetR/AcrR family transcriptional regulator [Paenibacillus foliorum]NOU91851.1 TetR family transcriptional regulator [Paenibacillus foliorum]
MSRREELKKIAVSHLLQFGYEGTKLADIAGEAGIKKQSMYAHFKDKKELVIEIHEEAMKQEVTYLVSFFNKHKGRSMKDILDAFILEMKDRYLDKQNVKLMFLMAFIPPEGLQDLFITLYEAYSKQLLDLLERAFEDDSSISVDSKKAALAVHTIYDGLTAKLIFESPEQFVHASEVTFSLLWEGIQYRRNS